MKEIEVIDFALTPSILNRYVRELRDVEIQGDQMRFRANLSRIGELMAYEISKRLDYKEEEVTTPLATAICREPAEKVVLATILRAGLP
ncbi:MAG: uracil phosphoribosyltransferase, partial [Muribaculaceae bacterium]|nr:uracil phosphoribosyltransferase [Muribaculaceae bacterium]